MNYAYYKLAVVTGMVLLYDRIIVIMSEEEREITAFTHPFLKKVYNLDR